MKVSVNEILMRANEFSSNVWSLFSCTNSEAIVTSSHTDYMSDGFKMMTIVVLERKVSWMLEKIPCLHNSLNVCLCLLRAFSCWPLYFLPSFCTLVALFGAFIKVVNIYLVYIGIKGATTKPEEKNVVCTTIAI